LCVTYRGFLEGTFLQDGLEDLVLGVSAELIVEMEVRGLVQLTLCALPRLGIGG
jgi:hypothetical protein